MTIDIFNFQSDTIGSFDLLIFAVGYEERSRFVAERVHQDSDIIVGYQFDDGHMFSFASNLGFLSEIGGHIMHANDTLESMLRSLGIVEFINKKICLDVSSLNRGAMAAILAELIDSDFFLGVHVTVMYAIARFSKPASEQVDFLDFAPLPGFSGWTSNPERPTVLVLGLGYETDHAIGALEYLDPSSAFAFSPIGIDERFDREVFTANEAVFDVIAGHRIVYYRVMAPYDTYWQMRSLIFSLIGSARVVLVPMGPKIFSSLCLVGQRVFGDEISVWRASGHTLAGARDVSASGEIAGYVFRRSAPSR